MAQGVHDKRARKTMVTAELVKREAALPVDQRQMTTSRIARAVLSFQDQLLEADATTGSLCQVRAGHGFGDSRTCQCLYSSVDGAYDDI